MKKKKVKELKEIIRHYQPGLIEDSSEWKFWLRKYKKQYNRGDYK